jgi:D-apionolactonase
MSSRSLTKAEKIFGTTQPTNKIRQFTAGPLKVLLDGGGLRNIQYNGIEVVRGISYLSRNADWGTFEAEITNFQAKQYKNAFRISYHAKCMDHVQELHYEVKIEAGFGDKLCFHVRGIPQTDFVTNRTGFIVLHPLKDMVGKELTVTHTDLSTSRTSFPRYISPGQPVFYIRTLKYGVCPGLMAKLDLVGDAFEMEDHRNWMDASYKTYVHSLKDIWPYTLKRHVPFEQSVTLTFEGQPPAPSMVRRSDTIKIKVGHISGHMPEISTPIGNADKQTLQKFSDSGIISFIAQLDGRQNDIEQRVKIIASLLKHSAFRLKLEIILPGKNAASEEIRPFAKAIAECGLKLDAVVITHAHDLISYQPGQVRPSAPSYEKMAAAARQAFPGIAIGGGVLTNFTELNRNPLPSNLFDFITHSLCPTVHASDDLSVMETLESLPWIFDSVRQMVGKLPYHIGPTSISARSNPYGKSLTSNPQNIRICLTEKDPRENGLYFAVWSFGIIAACAKAGIKNVAIRNLSSPALNVVGWLARAAGTNQLDTTCAQSNKVATLACEFNAGKALWIANLSRETLSLQILGLSRKLRMQRINTGTFNRLTQNMVLPKAMPTENRFDLQPYELVLAITETLRVGFDLNGQALGKPIE